MAPLSNPSPDALTVFVYGTLKEGFQNHAHYCRGVTTVLAAHTWGRLHLWEPGIPIMAVPRRRVLMLGSADVEDDRAAARALIEQRRRPLRMGLRPGRGWLRIEGQILVFPDGEARLRILDALEGFSPSTGRRAYQRVLLPVRLAERTRGDKGMLAAWAYVLPADEEPPSAPLGLVSWEPGKA